MQAYHVVVWSKGSIHDQSRFSVKGSECEACGKNIPSGLLVPVKALDKNSGDRLISLWLGCDCSVNIFGIKDVGIAK